MYHPNGGSKTNRSQVESVSGDVTPVSLYSNCGRTVNRLTVLTEQHARL